MQSIPKCLQTILHSSNSFFTNNYSHLSLLRKGGYSYYERDERNLLVSLTDDDTVYDNYIPTTIDSGWMLFMIAVVISVASIVFLPLNIRLGKYLLSRREAARNNNTAVAGDDNYDNTNNAVGEGAIEPYSAATAAASAPNKSCCQKLQSLHTNFIVCIADYLIYRWTRGRGHHHGRRERNARARAREARLSMLRIVAEEASTATTTTTTAALGTGGRNHHHNGSGEGGIELSVRRMTSPVPFHTTTVGDNQIELYQGSANNDDDSSSCLSTISKAWKFLMSIIRYDNETKRLLRLSIPFTITGIIFKTSDLMILGFVSQYLGTDAMVAFAIVHLTVGTTSAFLGGYVEAVSSLGSMAFGARNYFAVGQYVQLAVIFFVLCQLPFFLVWGRFIKEIILLFGFDETAADIASRYVWVALPLDIFKGIHESLLDFLEVIEYEAYANALACTQSMTLVLLSWAGLHFYDADLVFVGLIMLGCNVFFFLLNLMLCIGFGWLEKYAGGLIRSLALKNRPLVKEFLKTSAPLALGSLLAYAEWELLTVFAAFLGPAEAIAWAVLGFVWDVFESTTEAFGDAGEVRVSYQLGKGRPQLARLSSYKSIFMGLAMSIVMSTIFLSLINVLPEFLTTDQTIQDMLRMLFPLMALGNVTMSVGMVCWALVGAQLRYPLATAIATVCSFGITLPLGAIFTIVLNYDLKGLTFAVIVGYVMTAMLLSTVLLMSDWEKLSERIRGKLLAEQEEDSSSDDSSSSSSSSSSSEEEEDGAHDQDKIGGPLATKDILADLATGSNVDIGGINAKTSEETDVSSVAAIHQATVHEDPNVTSPDRIINRVVTWWG